MSLQQYKLHCPKSKRGIIFTLDAVIAMSIFLLVVIITTFYMAKAGEDKLAKINIYNAGSDALSVIDNKNLLKELDEEEIESELKNILLAKYSMRLQIRTNNDLSLDIGKQPPVGRFIGSGERFFVTKDNNFGIARFSIWEKE